MVWEQDPQCLTGTHLTTGHVVQEGYGVLDGGATKTMASIRALEQLEAKCGHQPGVGIHKLDVQETPTFGFGNSHKSRCVSTCYYKMPIKEKSMSLKIHALDEGDAPVLISVDSLRKLGAIVDFRSDQAVFCDINTSKLVDLKRTSAGHQLIPLTEDFLQQGKTFPRAATSLAQLVE